MKFHVLMFLVVIYGLSSGHNPLHAQPNLSISILTSNVDHVDSAKSVFGLNEVRFTVTNTVSIKTNVRLKPGEFKVANNNWAPIPEISMNVSHGNDYTLFYNDSIYGLIHVPLYNIYVDEINNLQSIIVSGGIVDFRIVFGANDGTTDSIFYSPVLHIVVPPASAQDAAALQYLIRQKPTCPDIQYFVSGFDLLTGECQYVYDYLATNFPESVLGKISKYTIAKRECRIHHSDIDSLPEVKAKIINIKNMLLSSDISYLKYLAGKIRCANN